MKRDKIDHLGTGQKQLLPTISHSVYATRMDAEGGSSEGKEKGG